MHTESVVFALVTLLYGLGPYVRHRYLLDTIVAQSIQFELVYELWIDVSP